MPDRPHTFRAQTPQAFRFATIRRAYERAAVDPSFHPTDDTRVVVDYLPDTPVAVVAGSESNLKITTLADMPLADRIAASRIDAAAGADGSGAGLPTSVPTSAPMAAPTPAVPSDMAKEEARARMHAMLAQAAAQLH